MALTVVTMYPILGVSVSGNYDLQKQAPDRGSQENALTNERID
jgi:hypothetical protein